MHDKWSSSAPEASVSGVLVHPSIAQVSSVWRVYVCVFSSWTVTLNAGHQTQLFPGERAILYRKHAHLPAVYVTC